MQSPRTLLHSSAPRESPAEEPGFRRIAPAAARAATPPRQADAEQLALGRYRLLARLGAGGFGEVWRAHDELLRREVAVKRIWLGPRCDRERATREALAAARLSHPAIVALYEAGAVEDAFYLISELVHGDTLARLIAAGELDDEHVLEIGAALADALAHAHERGVVHRDVKPQNVLVPRRRADGDGAAKLTDFGGASLVGEDALTRTGDVLGTLAYMAPEQSEGREVTAQADLYALALVLYEALSGVNPVRGPTPAATARHIGRPLAPLERRRRDLPRALTRALDAALAPHPADRGELEDLQEALEDARERGLQEAPARRGLRLRARVAPELPDPVREQLPHGTPQRAPLPEPGPSADTRPAEREPGRRSAARLALPRGLWLALALAAVAWQATRGRPGLALLLAAALAPLLIWPAERRPARLGAGWLLAALAPALGVLGLAGAFPALAGQAARWRTRASLGALGYWWLALAAPLLARTLWLSPAGPPPARSVWEGSPGAAAVHVLAPALTLGTLLGALLWAAGSAVLPWVARGHSAARDLIAAGAWSAALAAAAPALDAGLSAAHRSPRGLLLGAILAAALAVAARALRGPA